MSTREIAQEYRLAHWAGIMRERTESGLNIKSFCERTGIHENVYYYWQRKLREAACQELLPATQNDEKKAIIPSEPVGRSASCPPMPAGWAVCSPEKTEQKNNGVLIEIGKCRVAANADTDPELLVKVCTALMSLC